VAEGYHPLQFAEACFADRNDGLPSSCVTRMLVAASVRFRQASLDIRQNGRYAVCDRCPQVLRPDFFETGYMSTFLARPRAPRVQNALSLQGR
jgi:hypothetical protein